jgi:hypothetical protein
VELDEPFITVVDDKNYINSKVRQISSPLLPQKTKRRQSGFLLPSWQTDLSMLN